MKAPKHSALVLLVVLQPSCGQQLVEFAQLSSGKTDARGADVLGRDGAEPPDVVFTEPDGEATDAVVFAEARVDEAVSETGTRDGQEADVAAVDAPIDSTGGGDGSGAEASAGDAPVVDDPRVDADAEVSAIEVSPPDTSPSP